MKTQRLLFGMISCTWMTVGLVAIALGDTQAIKVVGLLSLVLGLIGWSFCMLMPLLTQRPSATRQKRDRG